MDNIEWLELWYKQNCDGMWEHSYGIKIETLDNPGWSVKIDLRETNFEDMQMSKFKLEKGENNWIVCSVEKGCFNGCGDSLKLGAIIEIFKECVRTYTSKM